ncbi:MAG: amidohydrolase [Chitinophagales bacterium]|nr:amidohydrolase [Chitinophagales bacterium]
MDNISVALVQSDIIWEDIHQNLSNFDEMLWASDADIVILPEMFTTGFSNHSKELAVTMNSMPIQWMHDLAGRLGCLLIGSMIIKEKENYYNRLIVTLPDGTIQTYDKRHLFSLSNEGVFYQAGTERLIIDYNGWKIAPFICYDLRFPVWSRNTEEVDLMIYLANWPEKRIEHWNTLLKARAIENQCYVAGVNRIGLDGNQLYYNGQSAIYDFWGEQQIYTGDKQGLYVAKISQQELKNNRSHYSFLQDRDNFELK